MEIKHTHTHTQTNTHIPCGAICSSLYGGGVEKALWGPGIKLSLGVFKVLTRNGRNDTAKT